MSDNTLQRAERLRSLKAIRRLFADGRGGFVYPFRYMFFVEATYAEAGDAESGIEVMFSVPKKFHKRANKRNVLKRRTREAYRLNREQLRVKVEQSGKQLDLALVYSTKDILSYKTIENAVRRILGQVCERM
jgi:ribonuclease P protein component